MCIPTMPERISCAFFLFFDGGGCCPWLMTNKRRDAKCKAPKQPNHN